MGRRCMGRKRKQQWDVANQMVTMRIEEHAVTVREVSGRKVQRVYTMAIGVMWTTHDITEKDAWCQVLTTHKRKIQAPHAFILKSQMIRMRNLNCYWASWGGILGLAGPVPIHA
ncbi:hypothetical protein VNO77_34359 [Canavalia gladiata]|uniref:Uncharacterized protein n=1 Tax=Canavalia gladiata TaxID=3824 RepID=A0AAN9PZQ7_CANGL